MKDQALWGSDNEEPKEENLEHKFKKETDLDAYILNDLRGHIATDSYIEWLEEQINK